MTIKLHALSRWLPLDEGHAIKFEKINDNGRTVRLHVNCERETTFNVEDADGPRLLVTVPFGLNVIEFSAAGDFAVFVDEQSGEVHYQTAEGEPTFARVVDPVIFTRIATRRHRNPELEEMMHRMQTNMERRMEAQSAEFDAALARRLKEVTDGKSAETVVTNAPGAAPSPVSEEVPEPDPAVTDGVEAPASGDPS